MNQDYVVYVNSRFVPSRRYLTPEGYYSPNPLDAELFTFDAAFTKAANIPDAEVTDTLDADGGVDFLGRYGL